MVRYIGTARNAAGIKYVNSARFITQRPPGMRSREIENAAAVAMNSVSAPTATAITTEFQNCTQKSLRK